MVQISDVQWVGLGRVAGSCVDPDVLMCAQERINEVEKTRLEYNNARQAVGVAHKAAVKLAAKKDATKIEKNPGVIHAEAVLTGSCS